jgi:hypothetical protein
VAFPAVSTLEQPNIHTGTFWQPADFQSDNSKNLSLDEIVTFVVASLILLGYYSSTKLYPQE